MPCLADLFPVTRKKFSFFFSDFFGSTKYTLSSALEYSFHLQSHIDMLLLFGNGLM